MKLRILRGNGQCQRKAAAGFTLIEVAFSAAIAGVVLAGMFEGYNMAGRRAQFSACNLAANGAAQRQLEQTLSAPWIPSSGDNTLLNMSGTYIGNLCLPSVNAHDISYTNHVTVTQISASPPYAMVQVQCVWTFPSYGGVFTNTIAVLRGPNS